MYYLEKQVIRKDYVFIIQQPAIIHSTEIF